VQIEFAEPALVERVVWARDREGKFVDRLATRYRIDVSTDRRELGGGRLVGRPRRVRPAKPADPMPPRPASPALNRRSGRSSRVRPLISGSSCADLTAGRWPTGPVHRAGGGSRLHRATRLRRRK